MKIIGNRELQQAFKYTKPTKIAVAYLGNDFEQYLDFRGKDGPKIEIVVSPTIGSHPAAIKRLVSRLGWERVHFHNRLHAKIYIGRNRALVSSANLSRNGLEVTGLREIGVLFEGAATLKRLVAEFQDIRDEAKRLFPTEEKKEMALNRLIKKFNQLPRTWDRGARPKPPPFSKYRPEAHGRFKLNWWDSYGDIKKNRAAKVTGLSMAEVEEAAIEYLFTARKNEVSQGDWVLIYRFQKRKDGSPKVSDVRWLFVDQIWTDCSDDDDYPNLAVEIQRKFRPILQAPVRPVAPFVIDQAFKQAFSDVVIRKEFSAFQPPANEKSIWYTNNSDRLFDKLISNLRKEMKQ